MQLMAPIWLLALAGYSAMGASVERFYFSAQHGGCFRCHSGWNFDGAIRYEGDTTARPAFFNTGVFNMAGATSYPMPNTGVHRVTGRPDDVGKLPAIRGHRPLAVPTISTN